MLRSSEEDPHVSAPSKCRPGRDRDVGCLLKRSTEGNGASRTSPCELARSTPPRRIADFKALLHERVRCDSPPFPTTNPRSSHGLRSPTRSFDIRSNPETRAPPAPPASRRSGRQSSRSTANRAARLLESLPRLLHAPKGASPRRSLSGRRSLPRSEEQGRPSWGYRRQRSVPRN